MDTRSPLLEKRGRLSERASAQKKDKRNVQPGIRLKIFIEYLESPDVQGVTKTDAALAFTNGDLKQARGILAMYRRWSRAQKR